MGKVFSASWKEKHLVSRWKPPLFVCSWVHFIKELPLNGLKVSENRETFQLEPPLLTFALNTQMRAEGSGMWATLPNWGNIWGFCLLLTRPGAPEPRHSFCLAVLRWRKSESANKDASLAVQLTNTDRQLTHSSENWGLAVSEGVRPHPLPTDSWLLMLWNGNLSNIDIEIGLISAGTQISDYIELKMYNINVHFAAVLLP